MSDKQTLFSRIKSYFSAILNSYKKGFSLIELSIVLIVVSVLIVGAIKGTELINNTRIIKVLSELNTFSKATNDFMDKYNSMPGLLTNASSVIPGASNSEGSESGYINEGNDVLDKNSFLFFNQLSYANFLGRDVRYDGGDKITDKKQITSKNYPFSKGFKSYFYYVRGDTIGGMFNQANRIALSDKDGKGLPSSILQAIDSKLDDGMPLTGTIAVVPTPLDGDGSCLERAEYYNNSRWEQKIVYSERGSNCGIFQILDNGVNVPNKNAEIGVEEEHCELDTRNLPYGDHIVERKIKNMISGSEVSLSCKTGYELNDKSRNKVRCENGNIRTGDFSGCSRSGCDGIPVENNSSDIIRMSFRTTDGILYNGELVNNGTVIVSETTCTSGNYTVTGNIEYKYVCNSGNWNRINDCCYDRHCVPNGRPFEMKIKLSEQEGDSKDFNIRFYNSGDNGSYNDCEINWGDGYTNWCDNSNNSHTYNSYGTYTIKIKGASFMGVRFDGNNDANKIIELVSYGGWDNITSLSRAFSGASRLTKIHGDAFKYLPNLKLVDSAFTGCTSLKKIPTGLFANNPNIETFYATFANSGLEEIPGKLFYSNLQVKDFSSVFRDCKFLKYIPEQLFLQNTEALYFNEAFQGDSLLESVPEGLFDANTQVERFSNVFRDCPMLSSIPDTLFKNNVNVNDFYGAFASDSELFCLDIDGVNSPSCRENLWDRWCKSAGMGQAKDGCKEATPFKIEIDVDENESFTIPFYSGSANGTNNCTINWGDGTFDKCDQTSNTHKYVKTADTFEGTFLVQIYGTKFRGVDFSKNATSAAKIKKLITYGSWNNKIIDATNAFANAVNLTDIEYNFFENTPDITSFFQTFRNAGFKTINGGIFRYSAEQATNFEGVFENCANLESLPSDLFYTNIQATNFSRAFANCDSLTEIPDLIFENNKKATKFSKTFSDCDGIINIPPYLFRQNEMAEDFSGVFSYCDNLATVPQQLFANNPNVKDFGSAFAGSGNLICSGIDGGKNPDPVKFDDWKRWLANGVVMDGAKEGCLQSTDDFIIKIRIVDDGEEESRRFIIPFLGTTMNGSNINCTIDWGDGTEKTGCDDASEKSHVYDKGGVYTVQISGKDFQGVEFGREPDSAAKIITLVNYGTWDNIRNIDHAFYGATNLTTIEKNALRYIPNVESVIGTFSNCTSLREIPDDLFRYNARLTNFSNVFNNSYNLLCVNIDGKNSTGIRDKRTIWPGWYEGNAMSYAKNNCKQSYPVKIVINNIAKNETFTIPFYTGTANGENDCTIDWGDGSGREKCSQDKNTHKYLSENSEIAVLIEGRKFRGVDFSRDPASAAKIQRVATYGSWGNKIVEANNAFNGAVNLINIDNNIFASTPEIVSFYQTFKNTGFETFPYGSIIFGYNTEATNFEGIFEDCANLREIDINTFRENTKATNFARAFKNCSNLQSIPYELFFNNTEITNFSETFKNCGKITSIPRGLFQNNAKVTNFSETFADNSNMFCYDIDNGTLEDPISVVDWPAWNANNVNMTDAKRGCIALTPFEIKIKISEDDKEFIIPFFNGSTINGNNSCTIDWGDGKSDTCNQDTNTHTYDKSGVYTVQIGGREFKGVSFSGNARFAEKVIELVTYGRWDNMRTIEKAFDGASNLTTIHAGAFKGIPNIIDAHSTFASCSSLTSIPSDLFAYNEKIESFFDIFNSASNLLCINIDGENSEKIVDNLNWPAWNADNANMVNAKIGCKQFDKNNFIINIQVSNEDREFAIPFYDGNTNGSNSCTIDWGDGKSEECNQNTNVHLYGTAGTYTVQIGGNSFKGVRFYKHLQSAQKITGLISYGAWDGIVSLSDAFRSATNLTKISDGVFQNIPNAADFSGTFMGCTSLESIPDDLFKYNTVSNFKDVFNGATSLLCSDIDGGNSEEIADNLNWLSWIAENADKMVDAKKGCVPINMDNFIIDIKISEDDKEFTIPFYTGETNGNNDCTIDWGDGKSDECNQDINTHTYDKAGIYTVQIGGNSFRGVISNNENSAPKIISLISYGKWDNIVDASYAFDGAINLITINKNAFAGVSNVENFGRTFGNCISLKLIPESLFVKNTKVKSFFETFRDCFNLQSIPENLFAKNPNVESFSFTFFNCSNLKSIPENLFTNNPKVTNFDRTFSGCLSLQSIPENLFAKNPEVIYFSNTFSDCSNLESIPGNLFANNPNVISFSSTFSGCSNLISIPENLFANNPNVDNFGFTFSYCSSLQSIPENLFAKNPNVISFNSTFRYCSRLALIPDRLFAKNPNVEDFRFVFANDYKVSCSNIDGGCSDTVKKHGIWKTWGNGPQMNNAKYGCVATCTSTPPILATFVPNGRIQTYTNTSSSSMTVKIEVYGAQGGGNGGYGGYSYGEYLLEANETLSVIVGKSGYCDTTGFYGGGGCKNANGTGMDGGGASAVKSQTKNKILIISGGGGGFITDSNFFVAGVGAGGLNICGTNGSTINDFGTTFGGLGGCNGTGGKGDRCTNGGADAGQNAKGNDGSSSYAVGNAEFNIGAGGSGCNYNGYGAGGGGYGGGSGGYYGGGGGSYINDSYITNYGGASGWQQGDGKVVISKIE